MRVAVTAERDLFLGLLTDQPDAACAPSDEVVFAAERFGERRELATELD